MEKKQLTVRIPKPLFDYLTVKADHEHKSMNDIMVEMSEQYMKWHEGEKMLQDIALVRERVKEASGIQPDSVEEIRRMREGER